VFSIFRRFSGICERASIDEAYLDVSDQVEEMVKEVYDWESELQRLVQVDGINGASKGVPEMVVEDGPLISFNAYDRRLLAGAIIAERIRSAVRMELGYTCSVGIATNKLLAKIASAKNKPDRQTLVGCSFLGLHLSFPTILCAAGLNPMWHLQISPVS
jgi:DNA polymerase eta